MTVASMTTVLDRPILRSVGLALLMALSGPRPELGAQEKAIAASDNQEPAGSLDNGVLTVDLVAEEGMWYPSGPEGFGLPMYAFRQADGPLQIPGPLIRVAQNADVVVNIRNALPAETIHLTGFRTDDASPGEVVRIPAGETRRGPFSTGLRSTDLLGASESEG